MKRINKTPGDNELTRYCQAYPDHDWDNDFRNHNGSIDYKSIKQLMLADQGGLCGYCEKKIGDLPENKQRVEHYHSKSDDSDPTKNWALDWNNLFAVCIGGSDSDQSAHPLPANLSCDSHKDHLIQKGLLDIACEGYMMNPLRIIGTANLFTLDWSTGELNVNKEACAQLADIENKHSTLEELVKETIKILNLNCQRLCDDRLAVRNDYNLQVKRMRQFDDRDGFKKLAQRWFTQKWPSFFTTKRCLLGKHAEEFLARISYEG